MNRHPSDYRLISRLFFGLLPYQVLLLVINATNGIVDSLCASNFIGKTAMSAIGLYAPLNHFLFAVSIMLVSGSQLLIGKAMGRNERESVQGFFSTDLLLSVGISVLTSLLLIVGAASDVARLFVEDATERRAMNQYILGQSVGIPALVLGQQLFAFLSMENQTKRTMVASFVCVVSNTLMNMLFVLGLKMGTFGLGLGSSMGLWAFFGTMAQFYVAGKSDMKFSARRFNWKDSLSIVRTGYPGAISRFVEMFRCIIVNMLILQYVGSVGLSAFAAVNSVMAVFWPIPFGMVAVTRMLLGISIGEEDRKSVADIMRVVLGEGSLFQCGVTLLIILLSTPLTLMFYRNPADPVYMMTLMGFRLLPLCMPLAVISLTFVCYAQATEKKSLSLVLAVLDGAVSVVALSFFLIPAMKMNGLYLANILNGFVCSAVILAHAWARLKRAPRNLEDVLLIPDGFGAEEDARIDIEVRQLQEVLDVSKQVIDFCDRRGIDRRRANFAGLAMEEMAGNVVEHGFSKDSRSHYVDIRVVHKGEDVILRLRDNCKAFNPLDRMTAMDSEDGIRNIGIRIVHSIAKDVQYQNLLGLNVLTIRI